MLRHHLPEYFNRIVSNGYLVGGAVRDLLCGRHPVDYDVAVNGDPCILANQLAAATAGHYFVLGKKRYAIHRVVHPSGTIDIIKTLGGNLRKDLTKGISQSTPWLMTWPREVLIDPLGGRVDLSQ